MGCILTKFMNYGELLSYIRTLYTKEPDEHFFKI